MSRDWAETGLASGHLAAPSWINPQQ